MSAFAPPIRSNSSVSTTSMTPSRTPSGPMGAATLIMNKQANHSDSLYYICLKLLKRLSKVAGMKSYLELAFAKSEENSEKQAIALSSKNSADTKHNSSPFSESLLSYWNSSLYTFSAGILPAQIGYDPVTPVWKLFQQGAPLCLIFNSLNPENSIDLVSSDDLKICKMSVYKFLSACKMFLNVRDDELFPITSVFSDDTNNLLKVIHAVNLVLDFDSRFDAESIPDQLAVTDSRSKVVKELVETERKFVQDLEILFQYRGELIKSEYISSENINMLFPNLNEIVDFQRRFLIGLECNSSVPNKYQRIGSVFLHPGSQGFKIYEPWSLFQNSAIEFIKIEATNLTKSSSLIGSSYELQSFLIKPIQRLCKYPMLLQELLKLTDPSWPNYNELHVAFLTAKEVANNINESQRKSENIQLVKDLQDKVIDWKGYNMVSAGDLLFANVVTVRDLIADGHSSEKEVHCYLFERVIFFFKEIQPKNNQIRLLTSSRKKSTTSLSSSSNSSSSNIQSSNLQLSLNGIVYVNKIYKCFTNEATSNGHYLTLRWKGNKDSGGCIIKFRDEEQINQWLNTIKRLSQDDYFAAPDSPDSAIPLAPTQVSKNRSSSSSSSGRSNLVSSEHQSYFLPKMRTSSASSSNPGAYPPLPTDKKLRSVSSPAAIMEQRGNNSPFANIPPNSNGDSYGALNGNFGGLSISQPMSNSTDNSQFPPLPNNYVQFSQPHFSNPHTSLSQQHQQQQSPPPASNRQSKINIKLINTPTQTIHLSVPSNIKFHELVVTLINKLNYSFGLSIPIMAASLSSGRSSSGSSISLANSGSNSSANGQNSGENSSGIKFKFRDEDGDFIRFTSDDDWLIAREMLEDLDDEEDRILNIKVV